MTETPVATSTSTTTVAPQAAPSTSAVRATRAMRRAGETNQRVHDVDDPSNDEGDSNWSFGSDPTSSDDSDDGSSSSGSSSNSDSSSSSDDSDDRVRRRRRDKRRSIKDLEIPVYSPSPNSSASVWIDRVDLALKGARRSGWGNRSDRDLYYLLGNKLRLRPNQRTWTNLKRALLRRYGERRNKGAAEMRMMQRVFAPGEAYADFAAGLREAAGRSHVRERGLLNQFTAA
ncbi:hypothetical protein PHMEG_00029037 [Phytophthora megakarya]|uniref:Uncharacterized protein n=1 Tax=Phytophthora megakarya TaxID=4795 RepID=A0A225V1Z6_9STRA|nr:hypothetical protein PHMEG_00029037 [Phytophthora megakarya]